MFKEKQKPLLENHDFKQLQALIFANIVNSQAPEVADLIQAAEKFMEERDYSVVEQRIFVVLLIVLELIQFGYGLGSNLLYGPFEAGFAIMVLRSLYDTVNNFEVRRVESERSQRTFELYAQTYNFSTDFETFRWAVVETINDSKETKMKIEQKKEAEEAKVKLRQAVEEKREKLSGALSRLSLQDETSTDPPIEAKVDSQTGLNLSN